MYAQDELYFVPGSPDFQAQIAEKTFSFRDKNKILKSRFRVDFCVHSNKRTMANLKVITITLIRFSLPCFCNVEFELMRAKRS